MSTNQAVDNQGTPNLQSTAVRCKWVMCRYGLVLALFMLMWAQLVWVRTADSGPNQEAECLDKLHAEIDRYGPRHFNTVAARLALADFYLGAKISAKAEPLLQQVLTISEEKQGATHPDLVPILDKMALLDAVNGRFAFAKSLYSRALSIATARFGQNDPRTQKLTSDLAGVNRAIREGRYVSNTAPIQVGASPGDGKNAAADPNTHLAVEQLPPQSAGIPVPGKSPAEPTTRPSLPQPTTSVPPVVSQPADPTEKGGFIVAMGCSSSESAAKDLVARVEKLALPAFAKSAKGGALYCAYGGPFPTKAEADQGAKVVRDRAHAEEAVVRPYKK